MADFLLGGYLHIIWQFAAITIGLCAFLVAKLVRSPLRRRIHMSLGVMYTGALCIGFTWGVLSIALIFTRSPFHSLHGIVGIIIVSIIVTGASLGLSIHFLNKRLFLPHFLIQFTGLMLALIQIILGMTLYIILSGFP